MREIKTNTEYQPIVNLRTGKIFAYEAQARYEKHQKNILPDVLFFSLRNKEEVAHKMEVSTKINQIKRRVKNFPLFLNFDIETFFSKKRFLFWVKFLSSQDNIVLDLNIHNSHLGDEEIEHVMRILFTLNKKDIPFSIDGFKISKGCSLNHLSIASFIKGDLSSIEDIKFQKIRKKQILINPQKTFIIAKKIETQKDVLLSISNGATYGQGYYYKKGER